MSKSLLERIEKQEQELEKMRGKEQTRLALIELKKIYPKQPYLVHVDPQSGERSFYHVHGINLEVGYLYADVLVISGSGSDTEIAFKKSRKIFSFELNELSPVKAKIFAEAIEAFREVVNVNIIMTLFPAELRDRSCPAEDTRFNRKIRLNFSGKSFGARK